MSATWQDFQKALDRQDGPVRFWLRDDDAVSDTGPLRQLANWAARQETQVLIALVPAHADDTLRKAMAALPQFVGAVHGWAHKNHAPQTEKKQELGAHRALEEVCAELKTAHQRTEEVADGRALPVLVPPWNRITADVVCALPALGFSGLSTFAEAHVQDAPDGLTVQNSHIDVIDWRGTRSGKPHDVLLNEMIDALDQGRQLIGILSHHLVHDEVAWSFLDALGSAVREHPHGRWIGPGDVFSL
ncbi:MAG: polysaccharide deacetylase family protein [Pseudomonadota bacterium]